jgi:adenine deaminase
VTRKGGIACINSDSAERARRLNTEAAKSMKYGGLNEQEALALITLNPAKELGIDNRVGTIDPGKDADLVIWNHHPLSIYAVAQKTMIDGEIYFDVQKDQEMRKRMDEERKALEALDKKNAPQGRGRGSAPDVSTDKEPRR